MTDLSPLGGGVAAMLTGLEKRLISEPDYRPHCLSCSTMERMTLAVRDGRRVMRCEVAAETSLGAMLMLARFGIQPRVGCGSEFDVHTGERTAAQASATSPSGLES